MDRQNNPNLNELLEYLELINLKGKINLYLVKYLFRKQKENFAVCLPDNMNYKLLEDKCRYLKSFTDKKSVPFNPASHETDTYEYISLDEIQSIWDNILELMKQPDDFKENKNKEKLSKVNLNICELQYKNAIYYLCAKQEVLVRLLKEKTVLMSSNDKLKLVDSDKLFLINNSVDFIICSKGSATENKIFIFNPKNFITVFNYNEHLKELVKENLTEIDNWTFISSTKEIKDKVEQKNVYQNLSKIFSDKEYLQQMKQVKPEQLKKRLIDKSNGIFSDDDFEGEKLVITSKNLENVMKMLAKGFKYNFFTDRAEEL